MTGPTLFILDVAEFQPLVDAVEADDQLTVRRLGDYVVAEGSTDITIHHDRVDVRPAIWFGLLTGGFRGRLEEYSNAVLRIVA